MARILLEEVRSQLVLDLAPARRILVGLPERDLLIAAGLAEGDVEFASMFADYVADRARAAEEPIDLSRCPCPIAHNRSFGAAREVVAACP